MEYGHRYSAYPTQELATELDYHINIHRQAYKCTTKERASCGVETANPSGSGNTPVRAVGSSVIVT
jgi:hypothetical protein